MVFLTGVVCIGCAWPLILSAIVVHELGHAAVVLAKTTTVVTVRIGARKDARQVRIGRLQIVVSRHGLAGLCHFPRDQLSRAGHIQTLLAGPLVSLAIGAALVIPAIHVALPLRGPFFMAAFINAMTGVAELFPYRGVGRVNPGLPSDGLQAWCYLRRRPIPRRFPPASGDPGPRITALRPSPQNGNAESSVPPPSK